MTRKKTTDLATCDPFQLYELANKGDTEALELLRKQLQDKPERIQSFSSLAESARRGRVRQMADEKQKGTALILQEQTQALMKKVAGDNPSPLERLLAERVAMCWLDVQDHELRYSALGNDTLKKYEWRSRMLDRAHNRYLSAVIALAKIRRLALPAVQVNIAEKQINTMGRDCGGE